MRILILNGPNINLLGQRESDIYGRQTLSDLESLLRKQARGMNVDIEFYQSNHEGQLIDALHKARNRCQGIVFNPAGYTHTSVALRDAIAAIDIPVIEIHISNIHAREDFRSRSLTAAVCIGLVSGLGLMGYELALRAVYIFIEDARRERAVEEKEAGEETESAEERELRRPRRGRRGGRGRRREGPPTYAESAEGDRGEAPQSERPTGDVADRYANLKGVTVRKGLDVLAEDDMTESEPHWADAQVAFSDEPDQPSEPSPAAARREAADAEGGVAAAVVEITPDQPAEDSKRRSRRTTGRPSSTEAEPAETKAEAATDPEETKKPARKAVRRKSAASPPKTTTARKSATSAPRRRTSPARKKPEGEGD